MLRKKCSESRKDDILDNILNIVLIITRKNPMGKRINNELGASIEFDKEEYGIFTLVMEIRTVRKFLILTR